jgi:hypothetical protein
MILDNNERVVPIVRRQIISRLSIGGQYDV